MIIAILGIAFSVWATTVDPVKKSDQPDLSSISIAPTDGVAIILEDSDVDTVKKWQRLYEPVGDCGSACYYKEYTMENCPVGAPECDPAVGAKIYTGNCKSTSGTVYSCTGGM